MVQYFWQVIRLLPLPFATSSATVCTSRWLRAGRQGHVCTGVGPFCDKEHRARAILSKLKEQRTLVIRKAWEANEELAAALVKHPGDLAAAKPRAVRTYAWLAPGHPMPHRNRTVLPRTLHHRGLHPFVQSGALRGPAQGHPRSKTPQS